MLAVVGLLFYRLLCLLGYGYVAYWTFENHPVKSSLKNNLLHVLYYALAVLLIPTRYNKLKSILSCVALTTSTVVSVLFWGIDYFDRSLLIESKELENLPSWYLHVTHTVISLTAMLDVLFSRPQPVPLWKAFTMILTYYLGYVSYVEYLIYGHRIYPYPLLRQFTFTGRYQFYGVVICVIILVFVVSCLFIRAVSCYRHSKPRRDKSKNKKSQHQQQHQQHQHPQKLSQTSPTNGILVASN
ncbi:unnamed protein product [Hydatigera taeniaeformis]|uniref:TLC domain-containing protein n=1 Tax=Hydatigena taeniaeformis TaxID=6205 RepID=A0A0R3X2G2_HYDTA|nr:unnamed protein product [Hydatigera taeniaeformis]